MHIPSHLVQGPICPVTLGVGITATLGLLAASMKKKQVKEKIISAAALLSIFMTIFVVMELYETYGMTSLFYRAAGQWVGFFSAGIFATVLLFQFVKSSRDQKIGKNSGDFEDVDRTEK